MKSSISTHKHLEQSIKNVDNANTRAMLGSRHNYRTKQSKNTTQTTTKMNKHGPNKIHRDVNVMSQCSNRSH